MSPKSKNCLKEISLVQKQNGYSTIWIQVEGNHGSAEYQSLRLPTDLAQLILKALEPVRDETKKLASESDNLTIDINGSKPEIETKQREEYPTYMSANGLISYWS